MTVFTDSVTTTVCSSTQAQYKQHTPTYMFQYYGSYSATPMTGKLTDTHTHIHMRRFLSVCYYSRVNISVS